MTDSAEAPIDVSTGLIARLGIEVVELTASRAEATMPVTGNTQPYGLLHGGASAALAETIASLAAMTHAGPGRIAVGVDLSITHHRGVSSGLITAHAVALHLGNTVATYDVTLTSDAGKRIATARLTCYLRSA